MISAIQKEVERALAKLQFFAIGKVKEIDFDNYTVRAEILTTGMITNWLRIGEGYVGNSFGSVKSPNIDDEILISFPDGNPSGQGIVITRLYGKDVPPKITEDEMILLHKSGSIAVIRKNGNIEVTSKSKLELIIEDAVKKIILNSTFDKIIMGQAGIKIGSESAQQPLVLGNKWLAWAAGHKHLSSQPGTPTSTPINPPTRTLLSQRHKTE